ncbi:MAG: ankyrin repeat domain-containing protein [Elainellaceae cyanobacterium]
MSLEVGLTAFKQGRYAEAIEPLQAYCQECRDSEKTQSRSYMQAEMGLIKAYQGTQQVEQAIARCQSLLDCDNEALKVWANRIMPSLSATAPAQPAEPSPPQPTAQSPDQIHLLETGLQAQKTGKLDQAITALAAYIEQCTNIKSRSYMQAQMALVKAYRDSGALEKAIAQCQPLLESENTALSCWAAKAMAALQSARPAASEATSSAAAPTANSETARAQSSSASATSPPSTLTKISGKTASYEFSAKPVSASGMPSPASSSMSRSTAPHRSTSRTTSRSPQTATSASSSGKRSPALGAGGLSFGVLAFVLGNRRTRRAVFVVVGVAFGIVRGCLEAGNVDYVTSNSVGEFPALHEAAGLGDVTTVQALLQQQTDPNSLDEEGNTPLFWAVSAGCYPVEAICSSTPEHQQVIEIFLTSGADANARNLYDETPLHWAAVSGNTEGMATLIDFGAAINSESMDGYTPLDLAIAYEAQNSVEFLQGRGGVVSAPALE